MKRNIFIFMTVSVFIFSNLMLSGAVAGETNEKGSYLTVPWDEFKTFLPLEKDEIILPMDIFQKLLEQTGETTRPEYTVKEGNVVLTSSEFKNLVSRMKPPSEPKDITPPFDYLITKAVYDGKMNINNTSFIGTFYFTVLKKNAYLKIPLLPQYIALEDIKVNGNPALIISENGYHKVAVSNPGEYVATATFSIKSSIEKGSFKIDLAIEQTPITLLKLELPLNDIDVEIPQAQQVLKKSSDKSTIVSAVITPGNSLNIQWKKEATVAEKIPPKLYSELYHLVSIDDDALKINTEVSYSILHSEVDSLRLLIPDDINVLNVSGEGVGEWQEMTEEDSRILFVPLTYGKKGAVSIVITSEKPLSEKSVTCDFTGMQTIDTVRETGYIGFELNTSAEVNINTSEGLEKIAVQKIPKRLYNKSVKPLMYAFRYIKHPNSLMLDIKKHEKIAVPTATISSANIVTLFTEDGKIVHRLVYQVRNSAKQFLEVQVPDKADIWSVFVDNKPVESSMNADGRLLVPLIRSGLANNSLDTFTVEIICCLTEEKFSISGLCESSLPAVDVMISQLIWSVYLPNDYSYHYFKSTLEKEEMIRGVNLFAASQRTYNDKAMNELYKSSNNNIDNIETEQLDKIYSGKAYKSSFRNLPVKEEQIKQQLNAELGFSGRLNSLRQQDLPQVTVYGSTSESGLMPIQIEIPTGGQVYRFAKTIVKTEDDLRFSVFYTQSTMADSLAWLMALIVLFLLYPARKKLYLASRRLKEKLNKTYTDFKKHINIFQKFFRSGMAPFVLFGLFVVCCFISKLLALFVIFIFWTSLVYQIFLCIKKRTEKNRRQNTAEL